MAEQPWTPDPAELAEFLELLRRFVEESRRWGQATERYVATATSVATAARDFADFLERTPGIPEDLANQVPKLRQNAAAAEKLAEKERADIRSTAEFNRYHGNPGEADDE